MNKKANILIVGGTWDDNIGKSSWFITQLHHAAMGYCINVAKMFTADINIDCHNGGNYERLQSILNSAPNFDIVFWFANVSNDLPKVRDVKAVAPKVMLVTSKRNDNGKYEFQELVQRALASKSNLMFEFAKREEGGYNIRVFDPLACQFYYGDDMKAAAAAAMERLTYLQSITRQSTAADNTSAELALAWYFNSFQEQMSPSNETHDVPEESIFINIVRRHAETFHDLMKPASGVKRFLGNCAMKPAPPQVGRCSKGMPSFKHNDLVFVSQRNVDKEFLDISHFVPVYMDEETQQIFYCGNNKPSVDTPIQLRLYKALPNIRYMLHSHCYIKDAVFTTKSIPCGAVEEVAEILSLIDQKYDSREEPFYAINLKGHGSIVMAKYCSDIDKVEYIKRPMPEDMSKHEERPSIIDYNDKLEKPCPLCGHAAVIETYKARKGFEATIHCDNCLLNLPSITFDTEKEAAEHVLAQWNKDRSIT